MVIYIGADHKGFALKQYLIPFLKGEGYEVADKGSVVYDENDDYPTIAAAVAEKVSVDNARSRGILVCGSGAGVCVTANKFPNVRAAQAGLPDQAYDSRTEDDTNVLCLGANYLEPQAAAQIVATWLSTPFSGEARHARRIQEIADLETKQFVPRDGGAPRKEPFAWR